MVKLEEQLQNSRPVENGPFQEKSLTAEQTFPAGHFYSPIPSLQEIKENEDKIFCNIPRLLPGINLNEEKQLDNLYKLATFYPEIPWSKESISNFRYYYDNPAFSYGDAITLFGILRLLSPKKLVEVGSGYSSCVTLDVNEIYFSNQIDCTFIEPYPELLYSLVKEQDKERITILPNKLQDIDVSLFQTLEENDILFIDSLT